MMKRKRKLKLTRANFWQQAIIEMTWLGFSRGMLFGGLYGSLLGLLMTIRQVTDYVQAPSFLLAAICIPLPFGAFFGMIAGFILGILNGVVISLSTRLFSTYVKAWNLYPSGVALTNIVFTLVSGVIVFSVLFFWAEAVNLLAYIIIPTLIAATYFAYASQHAARQYLAAMNNDESAQTTS